jgi:hypothetical protein
MPRDYPVSRIRTQVGLLAVFSARNDDHPADQLFVVWVVEPKRGLHVSYSDEPEPSSAPLVINHPGFWRFKSDGTSIESFCTVTLRAIGLPPAAEIIAGAIALHVEAHGYYVGPDINDIASKPVDDDLEEQLSPGL